MTCYNCGSPYHYSDRCPKPKVQRTITCHNCKQTGHKMDNCPQQQRRQETTRCYQCQKSGHRQADCPERKHVVGIESNSTCVVCIENHPDWIFDSCHHQCVCETCSKKLDRCPMCRKAITTGGKVFKV